MGLKHQNLHPLPCYASLVRDPRSSSWRTIVLFVVTALLLGMLLGISSPFVPAITGAIALAVATRTPYTWLRRHVRHPSIAAVLGVLAVVTLIVAPSVFIGRELADQVIRMAARVRSGEAQAWLSGTLASHPALNKVAQQVGGSIDLPQAAQSVAGFVASHLQGLLTGSVATLTQIVLMLFTLFFLFRDQEDAIGLFRSILPLREDQRDTFIRRLVDTIAATIQGSLTIAIIQGCLGGLMFWILGVPNAILWTVAMALLATIPSLGTFLIWMPVAVFLGLSGHLVKAAVLTGWGTFVIGTVDNVLYPTLVGSRLQLHTVPVLFAVLGGIGLFGISGIVLGPVILTSAITLLRFWSPDAVPEAPPDVRQPVEGAAEFPQNSGPEPQSA